MAFADWTKHSDTTADYQNGRGSVVPPLGAGVNAFNVIAGLGSQFKRLAYVNDLVGSVVGPQEVSGAFRLGAGDTLVRTGLIAMWDGISLDSTDKAYVFELVSDPITPAVYKARIRHGPSVSGDIITESSVIPAVMGKWVQLLLQMKFDQVGNLQLRGARSFAETDSVLSPIYTEIVPVAVIPREEVRTGGKFAFFVESTQDSFTMEIDHVALNTVLTVL